MKQRSTKQILTLAASAAVAHLCLLGPADAADIKWDAGGADNNLTTPANWLGDVAPGAADIARFDAAGNAKLTPSTAGGPVTYTSIFFGNLATPAELDAYVISGPSAITLGSTTAGNYLNNDSEVLQTINAAINMIGGTVNATNGSLAFGGLFNVGNGANIAGNNVGFNAAAGQSISLTGGIAGAGTATSAGGAITKTGAGSMLVTGNNAAWNGNVFVNGGTLRIDNGSALATAGRIETALTSGGTGLGALELTGGITLNKQVVTRARQTATINEVSIRNVSGNNTITNVGTGTGGSQFNYESAADNLTITTWDTTAAAGGRTLRMLGAGNGQISNWNPSANNVITVIKDGAGTWNFGAGMINAAVFGPVTVNGGTLVLDGGLGARVTGAPTVNAGGTLQVVSTDGTSGEVGNGATPTTLTVRAGGTLNASTFSTYTLQTSQTLVAGGNIQTGTLRADGDNIIRLGDSAAAGSVGTMNLTGNLSLSNNFAAAGGGVYFDLGSATTPGSGVNDLISVAGDLLIDNTGGPINVRVNPFGPTGLANGTYRLIDYTGPSAVSDADFNLVVGSGAATETRQAFDIATAANQVNLVVTGSPASIIWKGDGGANSWQVLGPTNWRNGPANPNDQFFQFDNVTFDDSAANTTVNLTGTLQPGGITADTASTYTLQGAGTLTGAAPLTKSGTGTLVIANTGPNTLTGPVTINAGTLQVGNGGGDGTLGAPSSITNNGTLVVNKSAGEAIAAVVSGTGAIVKRGTGGLTLSGANTYTGATTVEAGTVLVANPTALGDAATGTTVLAGGNIYSTAAQTIAEPLTIAGDGPLAGEGAIRTGGGVLTTFSAPLTLSANASLKMDGNALMTLGSTVTGADTTLTLRGDGGSVGTINGAVSLGAGSLVREGGGTWILAATGHSWTGGTSINGGTLQLGAGAVAPELPAGPITIGAAGTLSFGSDQTITFDRTVTGTGTIAQGVGGGTTTLTGDLSAFTGTLGTSQGGVPSTLIVPVPTGATVATVSSAGSGNGVGILRLTHSNALAANATINIQTQQAIGTGRLELGNNVNIAAGSINVNQRNNATSTILSTDGNNTLSGDMFHFTGGSTVNLEAAAGATLTFNGTIQPGAGVTTARGLALQGEGNGTVNAVIQGLPSPSTVSMSVTKLGTGTWTLTGANTYTAGTNVNAGTLRMTRLHENNPVTVNAGKLQVLDSSPTLPAHPSGNNAFVSRPSALTIANDGAALGARVYSGQLDLGNNDLILDYTDPAASPLAQIEDMVRAGYNGGDWLGNGITSSTANANRNFALAVADNSRLTIQFDGTRLFSGQAVDPTTILVKFTHRIDLDLDGVITTNDATIFNSNYSEGAPAYWSIGDVDYDRVFTSNDATIFNGFYSEALASVPEPGTLGVLAIGALGLLSRRRRA